MYKLFNFDEYDRVLLFGSGGKDSDALALYAIHDLGMSPSKLEIWHQAVDGRGETHVPFFDWPSTEGYVRKFAEHLGVRLGFQWRAKGIYGELYRENSRSGDVLYAYEDTGEIHRLPTVKGNLSTRRKFPAKSPDLRVRWCSSTLKVDVARRVINNDPALQGTKDSPRKILCLSGERREESPARARMRDLEHHPGNTKSRIVHHWRPLLDWKEQRIWEMLERHRILPHPVYYLGFPRVSCRSCIFFTKDHWATLKDVSPEAVKMLQEVENDLRFTIDSKFTLGELVSIGKSKITADNIHYIQQAVSSWDHPVITDNWKLPAGAFGKGGGSV